MKSLQCVIFAALALLVFGNGPAMASLRGLSAAAGVKTSRLPEAAKVVKRDADELSILSTVDDLELLDEGEKSGDMSVKFASAIIRKGKTPMMSVGTEPGVLRVAWGSEIGEVEK